MSHQGPTHRRCVCQTAGLMPGQVSVRKRDTEHPGMRVNKNGKKTQRFGLEGSEKWGLINYFRAPLRKRLEG